MGSISGLVLVGLVPACLCQCWGCDKSRRGVRWHNSTVFHLTVQNTCSLNHTNTNTCSRGVFVFTLSYWLWSSLNIHRCSLAALDVHMYIVQLSLSNTEIGEKLHQKVKFNWLKKGERENPISNRFLSTYMNKENIEFFVNSLIITTKHCNSLLRMINNVRWLFSLRYIAFVCSDF